MVRAINHEQVLPVESSSDENFLDFKDLIIFFWVEING